MRSSKHTQGSITRGTVGGIVGALVMAAAGMIVTVFMGQGFFTLPKLIAGIVVADPLRGGLVVVAFGVAIHLVVGAVFGAVFGAIARDRLHRIHAIGAGMIYGALIFFAMNYVVLPAVNPWMFEAMNPFLFLMLHLAYGATTAAFLAYAPQRRRVGQKARYQRYD